MWWYNGMGWGGWIVMTLIMVAFWSLVAFGVIAVLRGDRGSRPEQDRVERSPQQILDERFARGDISAEEYQVRQDALRAAH